MPPLTARLFAKVVVLDKLDYCARSLRNLDHVVHLPNLKARRPRGNQTATPIFHACSVTVCEGRHNVCRLCVTFAERGGHRHGYELCGAGASTSVPALAPVNALTFSGFNRRTWTTASGTAFRSRRTTCMAHTRCWSLHGCAARSSASSMSAQTRCMAKPATAAGQRAQSIRPWSRQTRTLQQKPLLRCLSRYVTSSSRKQIAYANNSDLHPGVLHFVPTAVHHHARQ